MNPKAPHVLLVAVDQWPANLLRCAGHPCVLTPTIDQLAANGVRFANAYSECPVCVPARTTLMTGLHPEVHGQKTNRHIPFPEVKPLARCFRDAGYQTFAVGKMHLQNQRARIGFDDILVDEEGRGDEGIGQDDYELFLGDHGYPGQRFAGGMCNNEYLWRPWHLPERFHVTNWAAHNMCRQIKRRDKTKPGFWYLSFSHPHPPLQPLQAYLDIYRDIVPPEPHTGDWARLDENTPHRVRSFVHKRDLPPEQIAGIRRAFYALCTHIDHQLRTVLGTLRDEGLLDDTVVMFLADHGECLGNHGHWAKSPMIDDSNRVPMILCGKPVLDRTGHHRVSDRLVQLCDVLPTLCDAAGIPCPDHLSGRSMLGDEAHEEIFGMWGEGSVATRMIRDARHKLMYYPQGNDILLFDMVDDPLELRNLARLPETAEVRDRLAARLIARLSDADRSAWVTDGVLTGEPAEGSAEATPNFNFSIQRGSHWPPPNRTA